MIVINKSVAQKHKQSALTVAHDIEKKALNLKAAEAFPLCDMSVSCAFTPVMHQCGTGLPCSGECFSELRWLSEETHQSQNWHMNTENESM